MSYIFYHYDNDDSILSLFIKDAIYSYIKWYLFIFHNRCDSGHFLSCLTW